MKIVKWRDFFKSRHKPSYRLCEFLDALECLVPVTDRGLFTYLTAQDWMSEAYSLGIISKMEAEWAMAWLWFTHTDEEVPK